MIPPRRPFLAGVVHLLPLPGAPRFGGDLERVLRRAVADARVYAEAGFDAVVVENFGDAPFFPRRVPPETVAALAVATRAVREAVDLPVGVNCLRNDGVSALAVAAAAGAAFVRVNVLVGAAVADQGVLEGEAHEVQRTRARLAPAVSVLADVRVKHAVPLAERPLEEEALDAVERGLSDGVIVSGARTGAMPDPRDLERLAAALGARVPILVGSGLAAANAKELLSIADGAIVGTSVKRGGVVTAPVDPRRAAALVRAVRGLRRAKR